MTTLKSYLVEETYELYDAIDAGDSDHMREELGDLLYQIYAHAQIAAEGGRFDIDDVANGISEKLVRRHPHVFGDDTVKDSGEVLKNWEQIKMKEKDKRKSIMEGIPRHLPSLLKAYRVHEKAARVGFDWKKAEDAVPKLDEEVREFKEALAKGDRDNLAEEAGDILFSMVNVLRLCDIDSEEVLQRTVNKFMERFGRMEEDCAAAGTEMKSLSIEELDRLWEKAKRESR
jgi:tetrapyrrole methylase family protein/MazG family protein